MEIQGNKPVAVIAPGLQAATDPAGKTAAPSITVTAVKPVGEPSSASTESTRRSAPPAGAQQLAAIAKQLQEFLQNSQRELQFSVDADTNTRVVTVRDSNTGDIIRQIPSEEALRIIKNLDGKLGSLVDQQA